jgi:hypothetical protein
MQEVVPVQERSRRYRVSASSFPALRAARSNQRASRRGRSRFVAMACASTVPLSPPALAPATTSTTTLAFARPRIERQAARLEPGAAAGSCATRQLSSSCMAPLIQTARLTPPFITTARRNCFEERGPAFAVICNLQHENFS